MNECVGERTGQQRIIPTEPHIAPLPSGYILTKCGDTAYVDALAPRLGVGWKLLSRNLRHLCNAC